MRTWGNFWGDEHFQCLDCGNGFMGVYTCQNFLNFTLLIHAIYWYVNYTSIELFFKWHPWPSCTTDILLLPITRWHWVSIKRNSSFRFLKQQEGHILKGLALAYNVAMNVPLKTTQLWTESLSQTEEQCPVFTSLSAIRWSSHCAFFFFTSLRYSEANLL